MKAKTDTLMLFTRFSLSHAFRAAFDNSELIVACVVGDGEAETVPLATSCQPTKMLSPVTNGLQIEGTFRGRQVWKGGASS